MIRVNLIERTFNLLPPAVFRNIRGVGELFQTPIFMIFIQFTQFESINFCSDFRETYSSDDDDEHDETDFQFVNS